MAFNQKYLTFIVDDDEDYCKLFKCTFAEKFPESRLEFFSTGQALLESISDASRALPNLIILDLMPPELAGLETLRLLKSMERLKMIPTLIFSISNSSSTISLCYQAGVNAYVIKPFRMDELQYVVNSICRYWLETSELLSQN